MDGVGDTALKTVMITKATDLLTVPSAKSI